MARLSKHVQVNEMADIEFRLPKQLQHWLKRLGVKAVARSSYPFVDLKGRGRYWRINCYGIFEPSCAFPDFDRWANSNPGCGFSMVNFHGNEARFRAAFLKALSDARLADINYRGRFAEALDERVALAP